LGRYTFLRLAAVAPIPPPAAARRPYGAALDSGAGAAPPRVHKDLLGASFRLGLSVKTADLECVTACLTHQPGERSAILG
jgi:hypothetical protein